MAKLPFASPRTKGQIQAKLRDTCSDYVENNAEDGVRALALQYTTQTCESDAHRTTNTTRRVLLTQQTWQVDSQLLYQRNGSLPVQSSASRNQDTEVDEDFIAWLHSEEPWKESPDTKRDANAFTQKAKNLKKALTFFNHHLSDRGATLQGHIIELQNVANDIDKVHKGVKIARITGGTAGALGVAALFGGVLLAPLTMGASLIMSAVGVGVATAGGVTGASAAITNKIYSNMDRKKVETILKEHFTQIEEIERCVKFICTNIECLKKTKLSTFKGLDWTTLKMARLAHKLGDSVGAIGAVNKSSGMIQGLTLGLNMYFSQEDTGQLKKGSETKFAKQIRKVAKQMQASLNDLMILKTVVESEDI